MTPPPRPRNVLYLLENRRISKRAFRAQLRPLSGLKSLRYINGLDPKRGGVIVGCVFTVSTQNCHPARSPRFLRADIAALALLSIWPQAIVDIDPDDLQTDGAVSFPPPAA